MDLISSLFQSFLAPSLMHLSASTAAADDEKLAADAAWNWTSGRRIDRIIHMIQALRKWGRDFVSYPRKIRWFESEVFNSLHTRSLLIAAEWLEIFAIFIIINVAPVRCTNDMNYKE